jgi:hypothetical protein
MNCPPSIVIDALSLAKIYSRLFVLLRLARAYFSSGRLRASLIVDCYVEVALQIVSDAG